MNWQVLQGVNIPFLGTALGAACVFGMRREMAPGLRSALNGLAAGIMVAASFFSLLSPGLEQAGLVPAAVGFFAGMLVLRAADGALSRLAGIQKTLNRTEKMVLAVTLHNLPEGMAVGAVYAGWIHGEAGVSLAGALALSLGIALQNFPEGAIVSMPLKMEGAPAGKAFWMGVLSGAVEPVGAAMMLLAAELFLPVLPYLLSFAAGAMFCVVIEELIPEFREDSLRGSLCFVLGFELMMALDVGLIL